MVKKILLFLILSQILFAEPLKRVDIAVTAYNVDRAVIKDTRVVYLDSGINWISFSDVAALIDPTSVHLTSPGIEIIEQNFNYDIVNDAKLLTKYIGEYVSIFDKSGNMYEGKLISGTGNIILENKDGILSIVQRNFISDIRFPLLPEGLITKPTLNWKINSNKKEKKTCEIAYITKGMSWKADYEFILDKNTLTGMVTINNQTGATYKNAKLKLVAGEVNIVQEQSITTGIDMSACKGSSKEESTKKPQFTQKDFFEYHLYTLQRRTTLLENQTKQIDFVEAMNITAEKFYVYDGVKILNYANNSDPSYGTECNKKVDVYLEFKNNKDNNLGIPLPKGKIRIKDNDSFIGEDEIEHTPIDEKITLKIGQAFNLIGERRQTNFVKISKNIFEETFEIVLRNHKNEDVEIRIVEHLYRNGDWVIMENNHDFIKTDSKTIEYRIKIPVNDEQKINYKVRYKF